MPRRLLHPALRGASSVAVVAGALLLPACEEGNGDDGAPACVPRDAFACTPLYEPTWDRVFAQTIEPRCGTAGAACHAEPSATGAQGGFLVTDMAATHATLLDGFVVPGDAACSDVMIRLDTDDELLRMPPGSQALDEDERCAVARWIEEGASQ